MKDLNIKECIETYGGATPPNVSNDHHVQSGYTFGWHIGHAVGNTVQMFGNTLSSLGVSIRSWFD